MVGGSRLGSERLAGKKFSFQRKTKRVISDRPVYLTRIDGHAAMLMQKRSNWQK